MDQLLPTHSDPTQKKVVQVYLLFAAGLGLSLVPNAIMALVSGALILVVLSMAYMLRSRAEEGSLMENHMTFIMRTIWIGSLLALVTMGIAAFYIFKVIDNTPLQPCADKLMSMGLSPATDPTVFMNVIQGCWDAYWTKNMLVLIAAGAMAAGPILLYFLVRFGRGFTRARGGYRLASPKAWF